MALKKNPDLEKYLSTQFDTPLKMIRSRTKNLMITVFYNTEQNFNHKN